MDTLFLSSPTTFFLKKRILIQDLLPFSKPFSFSGVFLEAGGNLTNKTRKNILFTTTLETKPQIYYRLYRRVSLQSIR